MYVGSAVNLKNRKKNHLVELRLNRHYNIYLQAAYNKYGENNIIFEVLEYIEDKNKLIEREQFWIDKFNSSNREFGYNLSPTAGSPLGYKHTAETKIKVGKISKSQIRTKEWNNNISKGLTGLKATDTAKSNISNALKGRTLTEDHIFNRSANQRNYIDWPCFNGYYCKCRMCMDKRAANMRAYRKSKMES